MNIARNIEEIKATLPAGVELVAVSKFHPAEAVAEAYAGGQRAFGESRVQELTSKAASLPGDIRWHFIGHLQSNKVRQLLAVPNLALIESIDSERLLTKIDNEAAALGINVRVLMQVHVAAEETKFGMLPEEFLDYFRRREFEKLKATHLCGIMGMASNTDNQARVRTDFEHIAELRRQALKIAPDLRGFDTVSMGMSHDYPLAISCGATLVRVGTAIFGDRTY